MTVLGVSSIVVLDRPKVVAIQLGSSDFVAAL